MSEPDVVLNLHNVAYVAGGARPLDRIGLTLRAGERLAVTGANGAGKSTIARLAVGLAQPAEGHVALFGEDLASAGADAVRRLRGRVGLVLQGGSLLSDLSVEDNLRLGLGVGGRRADSQRLGQRIDRILLDFNLEHLDGHPIDALSAGEKRRVELARAVLRDPDLLILDDPFEGASSDAARDLEARTVKLLTRRPRALLLLTHDEALATGCRPMWCGWRAAG